MSKTVICKETALAALMALRRQWGWFRPATFSADCKLPTKKQIDFIMNHEDFSVDKIEVLVSGPGEIRKNSPISQSYYTGPRFGVVVSAAEWDPWFMGTDILIASPAFLLAQLAQTWDYLDLLNLALQFGGTYTINCTNSESLYESCSNASNDIDADLFSNFCSTTFLDSSRDFCSNTVFEKTGDLESELGFVHNIDLGSGAVYDPTFDLCSNAVLEPTIGNRNMSLCSTNGDSVGYCKSEILSGREPFVTKHQLVKMSERLHDRHWTGLEKFRQVARFFASGSASPMESKLYTMFALPTRLGGLGVTGLQLNQEIPLSTRALRIAGQGKIIVDILHSASKVVIEYDSRDFHSEIDQSQRDKRRRDALQCDGYTCFSIVTRQATDRALFNECAHPIVKAIKGRYQNRAKCFDAKQNALFNALKRWKY